MARRRKKSGLYERIMVAVSKETAEKIKKIADEDGFSKSAIAGSWLDERAEIEEVLEMGGSVKVELPDGSSHLIRSNRIFKLNSSSNSKKIESDEHK